ncbi:MAG TPA: hypothetical protein VMH02_03735 [Verrucomicrobiae bacterium]|nr:hypothetical protein [Verrucomicrobiae bacterium]
MQLFARIALGAALCAGLLASALVPAAAATPVLVKQCFITQPKALSKNASGTQIDYVIYGKKNAAQITFAVGYRNAENTFIRQVTDVGNFAPGVEIQHHFSLYNDVTYAGKAVRSCVPVKVKWADSTLWIAPSSH